MFTIRHFFPVHLSFAILIVLALSACQESSQPPRPPIVQNSPTPSSETASSTSNDVETSPPSPPTATATKVVQQTEESAVPSSPKPLESLTLQFQPIATGFDQPLYFIQAGDGTGRYFVVEQAGRILIVESEGPPFLDIVPLVGSSGNEQGLLSVAFHPNFAENGFFFINYTDTDGDTIIARYTVSADDPDQADPDSAKILLTINQPYANHNGGLIKFGPDGYLYVGMGDGGAANDPHNNGQALDTLLGKILRLDVDNADPYGVPNNNPFADRAEARPEIWSYGWRNPWRFSFDRETQDMYIGDVGQNEYEEIDVELAETGGGQNYGWRLMEGNHCFIPDECNPEALNVVLPIAEYDHSKGCSVTGGYVYRGSQFPDLQGIYFYGDFCSGIVWGLRREADGSWSQTQFSQTDYQITSFGEDEAGELYLVDRQGTIFQIGN